jgi:hypothetical protein
MTPRIRPALVAFAAACCTAALLGAPAAAHQERLRDTLTRPQDPVVLTGADVPTFEGISPRDLVAFAWSAGWVQIPVQVDERAMVDYGKIYGRDPIGLAGLVYTDRRTFTGRDPDRTLDADDEIAFMAGDAGGLPSAYSRPAGVDPASGEVVTIEDPLTPGSHGYVVLFRTTAKLKPGAGERYVRYTFDLLSGSYKATYGLDAGPNPEDSTVVAPGYGVHFADRWIDDALTVKAGASTGADILERHKTQFGPGDCTRTEWTFTAGEGAFIANKSGPVRAIRSYLGANSGPLTERDHLFYQRREDISTELRVHEIPGILDYFDYSSAARGMTYTNDAGAAAVKVNGIDDVVPAASPLRWELVTGKQGSLIMAHRIDTDIAGLAPTSYYLDDATPGPDQCVGQGRDAEAYAQSGPWVDQAIASTDPGLGSTKHLTALRTLYFEAPGATTSTAQQRAAQARTPLSFTVAPWTP